MSGRMRGSRSGRLAQLGGLAAGQAARQIATRTANTMRTDSRAAEALEARNAEMAKRLVVVLGSMRGAAMKFGQMISMVDGGIVPPSQREEFQRQLAELHNKAPEVPWSKMRSHIDRELGRSLDEVFDVFDSIPVAAASIGQVYRATTRNGRDVAVKVQYPGIETAVRADLKNISAFLRVYGKVVFQGLDAKDLAKELSDRIMEELDYELEASNTRAVARAYRDHPFIVIPDVVDELSSQRILVTDWVDGRPLSSIFEASQSDRNRIAEILFRFYAGTSSLLGMYSGDPHPGNSLVLDSGRVAFLDFGLMKAIDPEAVDAEFETVRAVAESDAPRLLKILIQLGFIPDPASVDALEILEAMRHALSWYACDATVNFDPELANELASSFSNPRTRFGSLATQQNLPADHAFKARADLHLLAILGQLRAQLNLFDVTREWAYGEDPVTPLGRLHADWLESR